MLRFINNEDGQGMVEYGLIIALVALAAIAGLTVFGKKVYEVLYERSMNKMPE
jgi:pilus assembly protein Flp/PilA